MSTPETLALDICRVKELALSNREYFVLVDYLSKDTDERYRRVMGMRSVEIFQLLDLTLPHTPSR